MGLMQNGSKSYIHASGAVDWAIYHPRSALRKIPTPTSEYDFDLMYQLGRMPTAP
jgi:hypothetical protein